MKKYLFFLTSIGILLTSCGKDDPEVEDVVFDKEEIASIEQLNRAAFRLYDELVSGKSKESYAFSPLSIEFTLGMEANSIEHPSLVEFLDQNSLESGNSLFEKIRKKLNQRGNGNESSLSNALFNNTLFPKDKNLNAAAKDFFKADIYNEDFTDYEAVRDKIHDWLMKNTKEFLNIPEVGIDPLFPRVLCNALYFKHKWADPFSAKDTYAGYFTGTDGYARKEQMMHKRENCNYYTSSSMTSIEKLYENKSFSMIFILSDKDALSFEDYQAVREGWTKHNVKITLPKFDTETMLYFNMGSFGFENLFGLHVARVKTDEEGTEAAAVTELILGASGPTEPDVVFKADRPFFYVITDNETGLILFIGRYC